MRRLLLLSLVLLLTLGVAASAHAAVVLGLLSRIGPDPGWDYVATKSVTMDAKIDVAAGVMSVRLRQIFKVSVKGPDSHHNAGNLYCALAIPKLCADQTLEIESPLVQNRTIKPLVMFPQDAECFLKRLVGDKESVLEQMGGKKALLLVSTPLSGLSKPEEEFVVKGTFNIKGVPTDEGLQFALPQMLHRFDLDPPGKLSYRVDVVGAASVSVPREVRAKVVTRRDGTHKIEIENKDVILSGMKDLPITCKAP